MRTLTLLVNVAASSGTASPRRKGVIRPCHPHCVISERRRESLRRVLGVNGRRGGSRGRAIRSGPGAGREGRSADLIVNAHPNAKTHVPTATGKRARVRRAACAVLPQQAQSRSSLTLITV